MTTKTRPAKLSMRNFLQQHRALIHETIETANRVRSRSNGQTVSTP